MLVRGHTVHYIYSCPFLSHMVYFSYLEFVQDIDHFHACEGSYGTLYLELSFFPLGPFVAAVNVS